MKAALVRFALTALVPAALNIPAPAAASLAVPVCTGDGLVHMVRVPVGGLPFPGRDSSSCCAKGCHAGNSRVRRQKNFEPEQ